jgi:FeS assembly SUF system regulator
LETPVLRLSRMTDYAVVVLSQMARSGNEVFAAPDLAEATGLPLPSVSKVLRLLALGQLIASRRGAAGGYVLARPPSQINVAQIIGALEGPVSLTACVDGAEGACKVETLCPLRGHWDVLNRAVRGALEQVSLAELASAPPDFIDVAPARAASVSRPI